MNTECKKNRSFTCCIIWEWNLCSENNGR